MSLVSEAEGRFQTENSHCLAARRLRITEKCRKVYTGRDRRFDARRALDGAVNDGHEQLARPARESPRGAPRKAKDVAVTANPETDSSRNGLGGWSAELSTRCHDGSAPFLRSDIGDGLGTSTCEPRGPRPCIAAHRTGSRWEAAGSSRRDSWPARSGDRHSAYAP